MEKDINNFLVPNHRKLDEKEVSSLLEKFEVKSTFKLPKIKVKDSSLSSLDVQVGDVLEISRTSFAGETKYYRLVIN